MNRADELTEAGVMLCKGATITGYFLIGGFITWYAFDKYSLAAFIKELLS